MKSLLIHTILALFAITGCIRGGEQSEDFLARVGNETLSRDEARTAVPRHIYESDSLHALQEYATEWVRRQLILQEADRINFASRQDIQKRLKRMREEFIIQAVQDYILSESEIDIRVSEREAQEYFQQNKDKFTLNERFVRYRHVIADSYASAEAARNALMSGMAWEDVANRYSKYPDLKIRESQQFWPVSVAGGEVDQMSVFLGVIGITEISPIHRYGNEYHFVQLMEERPEGEHPDLSWLMEEIRQWLVLEKRKRAFNTYVKNLYLQGQANNEIEINNVQASTVPTTTEADTTSPNNRANEE